jgi:glycosyltransferase involved in cell wall biosynthesis
MTNTHTGNSFPKVSIGIPTLNRVEYLKLAVGSALAQDYTNLEVIVSNNSSSDTTKEYLEAIADPRLRLIHHETQIAMVENWNACVAAATGELFLLLSDDDLLEPTAIGDLVGSFENAPGDVGIAYCGGWIIDSAGNKLRPMAHSPQYETAHSMIMNFFEGKRDIWFCGILFRSEEMKAGFPLDYSVTADTALWIQNVCTHGASAFAPKELVCYRVHPGATSRTPIATWEREMNALGRLAIHGLREHAGVTSSYENKLSKEIRKRVAEYAVSRMNADPSRSRRTALREYGKNLSRFKFIDGVPIALRGIASLLFKRYLHVFHGSSKS